MKGMAWPALGLGLACALGACGGGAAPAGGGAPGEPPAGAPADGPVRFEDATARFGLDAQHAATRTAEKHMPEVIGAGVAVADFDRNGAPDVFVVGGGRVEAGPRAAGARDRLFLNDGRGNLRDVSEAWGVGGVGHGMGVAVGDHDGDGWPDLLTTSFGGGLRLHRNTGSGFEDVTERAGLAGDRRWSTSAGFFDADGDGDLDLYVVHYVEFEVATALRCWHNERHIYCSPALYEAEPDTLWRNQGDGTFVDDSEAAGIAAHPAKGLALVLGDVDWDGDVDAFVANDITRNLLFVNDGAGVFEERGRTAGVAYDESGRASAGMGADLSDVDGDGRPDLSCTNFQDETTNVYLQRASGVFRDRSYAIGVGASAQEHLSWGVDFLDVDNDGDEDLFVANGHIDDGIGTVSERVSFAQQNSLFVLEGGRFEDVSDRAGDGLRLVEVTRGAASADLDGDGRLDLVLSNNGGRARVLRNATEGAEGRAVLLWLEGAPPNTTAIGARVEAEVAGRTLRREVRGASSYASFNDPRIHIGLGGAERTGSVRVRWPSGSVQLLEPLGPGTYRLVEGEAPVAITPGAAVIPPR
jgi:hypothetical protein